MFITFIRITSDRINERFPCTQSSAQKNFHAATSSRLATNVKRKKDKIKILQPIENDRSILVHKSSNATLTKRFSDKMSKFTFTKRISRRTLKLLIPDDFRDNCVIFVTKIASLTRDIAVQSFRTVTQADDFTHR